MDETLTLDPWLSVAADEDEPIFPPQICAGCGAEHPGLPCDLQDDLFGVTA